jgi:hypothetical protein
MAVALPYLVTSRNVAPLFAKISAAKVPDAFSQPFLYQTIGFKSNNDRALIPLLRSLGFIDASGKPTSAYSQLKNPKLAGRAIAKGIKTAYEPLFEANEDAQELSTDDLKGLVAQVAGTEQETTRRIVSTFQALTGLADFTAEDDTEVKGDEVDGENEEEVPEKKIALKKAAQPVPHIDPVSGSPLRPEFHYNIQVHLPSNATEETYLAIFNSLRRAFS